MNKKSDERRIHSRVPIAADLGEPVEIKVVDGANHAKIFPAILANISIGGMALIAFGGKDLFNQSQKIQLVANLPGMAHAKLSGEIMHIRTRSEMQTLGVRFVDLAAKVKERVESIVNDYDDCETRISLSIPEVCTGHSCHYFGLCKKTQKSAPQSA